VYLCTLSADQRAVILRFNLKDMRRLVLKLSREAHYVQFGSISLYFWSFDLNLTIVDFDINIKLITNLIYVFTFLANQKIRMFLIEVARCSVISFGFFFDLLVNKFQEVLFVLLHCIRRSTKLHRKVIRWPGARRVLRKPNQLNRMSFTSIALRFATQVFLNLSRVSSSKSAKEIYQ